jgi:pyruvate formate lyase activating enzyme
MDRRFFLKCGIGCAGSIVFENSVPGYPVLDSTREDNYYSCEALHCIRTPRGFRCELCPNECTITESKPGSCQTRIIKNDKLVSIAYGNPYYVNTETTGDQLLYHFIPGSKVLSIGTAGCNFSCQFCAVSGISQKSPLEVPSQKLFPNEAVEFCLKKSIQTIVYTYTEPSVFYEYMLETAKLARLKGMKNVMVTNGYIREKPMLELVPYLDASLLHLKAFSESTYQKLAGGSIFPVFDTLTLLKKKSVWLELNHLLVPGWTDNFELLKKMTDWMVSKGFENTPLHFSKFRPAFRLSQTPETSEASLRKAKEIAVQSGINYVYLNDPVKKIDQGTNCHKCHHLLMERKGNVVMSNRIKSGKCSNCGETIAGVW